MIPCILGSFLFFDCCDPFSFFSVLIIYLVSGTLMCTDDIKTNQSLHWKRKVTNNQNKGMFKH